MSNDILSKYLKILAIITLIIFISYTLIQIGSYFMSLVTIFGISIILTYVLLVPVNHLEKLLDRIISAVIGLKTPDSNIKISGKEIELPDIVMFVLGKILFVIIK